MARRARPLVQFSRKRSAEQRAPELGNVTRKMSPRPRRSLSAAKLFPKIHLDIS